MAKKTIPPMILLILGLIIAIGSTSFLGPCIHQDGSFGTCHWAGRMLLGLGGLMSVLALLAVVLPECKPGLYVGISAVAVLGMIAPGALIPLCAMDTMRCRMLMKPAMTILCGLVFLVSTICAIAEKRKKKAP